MATSGIILSGCGQSSAGHGPVSSPYYLKRLNVEAADLYADLGLEEVARFEIKAPPDVKCLVWLETYKRGKLVADLSWGYCRWELPGRATDAQFRFTMFRPPVPSSTTQKKTKCELGFTGWHDGRWIDDPFPWGRGVSSNRAKQWDLEFGKDYVVWSRAGSYGGSDLAVNTELMHNDAVMLVKCRIEPFGPKRESGCGSRPLERIPPDGAVAQDSCPATPPMTRWHRASPASRDEGKR